MEDILRGYSSTIDQPSDAGEFRHLESGTRKPRLPELPCLCLPCRRDPPGRFWPPTPPWLDRVDDRFDRAGYPFIGGALGAGAAGGCVCRRLAGSPSRSSCSPRFFLFFFRDPDRLAPAARPTPCCRRLTAACWSPGRGRRRRRRRASGSRSASSCRRWTCTSTACRSSGRVTRVSLHAGRFLPAYRHDAGDRQRAQRDLDRPRRPADRRASDRRHARAARRLPRRRPAPTCAPATASAS